MQKRSFNSDWQFHLGEPAAETWGWPKDAAWREVELPHDWSIELPRKASHISGTAGGYFEMGRGWYRKTLFAPQEWAGKKVFVEFEGVYMNAEVWLNEHFLGRHPYGYNYLPGRPDPVPETGCRECAQGARGQQPPAQQPLVLRLGHLPPGLADRRRAGPPGELGRLCHHPAGVCPIRRRAGALDGMQRERV